MPVTAVSLPCERSTLDSAAYWSVMLLVVPFFVHVSQSPATPSAVTYAPVMSPRALTLPSAMRNCEDVPPDLIIEVAVNELRATILPDL